MSRDQKNFIDRHFYVLWLWRIGRVRFLLAQADDLYVDIIARPGSLEEGGPESPGRDGGGAAPAATGPIDEAPAERLKLGRSMVDVERDVDATRCRFVLRPNRSMSWRGSLYFFLGLCLVSGAIATGWAMAGYWMVLPFAGLELLAVGGGLYVVSCRCHQREVIFISATAVCIEKGINFPKHQWTFSRPWVRIVLEPCDRGRRSSRLFIRSRGQAVEIGGFLNETERRCLALQLMRAV